MKYKEAKIEYEKALLEREKLIEIEAEKALEEIRKVSSDSYKKAKKNDQEKNEAPCSVCGKKEFILKYRDVNGKITGRISGSFHLFGGSISGYIDGETHTDPILSCRNCENERKIILSDFNSDKDVWEQQLPSLWDIFDDTPASKWLQEKGVEIALKIQENFYFSDDHNRIEDASLTRLEKVLLKSKYHLPKKPKWYNFIF